MAINKKLIHFNNKATFNSKKLSANSSNTEYTLGVDGPVTSGSPEINYQSIVFIKDTQEIWTHGSLYSQNKIIRYKLVLDATTGQICTDEGFGNINGIKAWDDLSNFTPDIYSNNLISKIIVECETPSPVLFDIYKTSSSGPIYVTTISSQSYTSQGKPLYATPIIAEDTVGYAICVYFGDGYKRNFGDNGSPAYIENAIHILIGQNFYGTQLQWKSSLGAFDVIGGMFTTSDSTDNYSVQFGHNKIITQSQDYYTVPSPSSVDSGKILTTDGQNIKWSNLNLEDTLTYGVEWTTNQASPNITRIGNMNYHSTLPIQSKFKGCVAQGNQIKYYLDPNDWNLRENPIAYTVTTKVVEIDGVKKPAICNSSLFSTKQYLGYSVYDSTEDDSEIPITELTYYKEVGSFTISDINTEEGYAVLTSITEDDDYAVSYIAPMWEELGEVETTIYFNSRLDGYDGTVRVETPEFYIKSEINGNTRRVLVGEMNLGNGWEHQPSLLIDAYCSTLLKEVPANMGYLSTLPVGSAISVVNYSDYCLGGRQEGSAPDSIIHSNNKYQSFHNKPATKITLPEAREAARKSESEVLSYSQYKNIFYWLYVIEYANFNCQANFINNSVNTYKQGGLGPGLTTVFTSHDKWNTFNTACPITPNGFGNTLGNNTGIIPLEDMSSYRLSGNVPRWRGFDNVFGDIVMFVDGIYMDLQSTPLTAYVINNPSNYSNDLETIKRKADRVITLPNLKCPVNQAISEFSLGENADIVPSESFNNYTGTQRKCDHVELPQSDDLTVRVGGSAYYKYQAGIGAFAAGIDQYPWFGFKTVSVK